MPGSIFDETSRAPHRLVQQGASWWHASRASSTSSGWPHSVGSLQPCHPSLQGIEAAVHAQLGLQPQHVDALALRCRLPISEVSRVLTLLEVRGLVWALPGRRYVRANPKG